MNPQSLLRITFLVLLIMGTGYLIFHYTQPSFPMRRVIESTEGKSIDVVIIGKIADTIYLNRMPDETRFTLNLDQLKFKDRTFLGLLKEQAPPPDKTVQKLEFEDSYIQNRVSEIEELKEKVRVMKIEANAGTLSPLLRTDYKQLKADLENEIKALEVAIETHRYQLKKK